MDKFWSGRRVLVTGHTGFKGAWLSLWLSSLGAEVHGLALAPPTEPSLYQVAGIGKLLASDMRTDIRGLNDVLSAFESIKPEVVFHLAAQSLVNYSYEYPIETFAVNVLGTAHVLEAVRHSPSVRAVVIVTTDKCYENREWLHPYRETDRLGGHDPYSASKACAELVAATWRNSFFTSNQHHARIATARAGNVIGGGDWAAQRLIPDCVRAYRAGAGVTLRYPQAVRPWQHVLEPLAGYLALAERLTGEDGENFAQPWNFGPDVEDSRPVGDVARMVGDQFGISIDMPKTPPTRHEAGLLRLDSTLAKERLGWRPRWALPQAVSSTVEWYRHWLAGSNMHEYSISQIDQYQRSLADD